jgi:hypothetical protein
MVAMTALVTKLLGPPEKVGPFSFFPTRPRRWMIFETRYFKVYLHHAYDNDLDVELRAYPEQFISFGFGSSDRKNSAPTPNAGSDSAAWMMLITKSPRQNK